MRYSCLLLFFFHLRGSLLETTVKIPEDFRIKRQVNGLPLVYPYGATYKLVLGIALPVPNKDKINLAFAANFQYQYVQFQNISQLSQYYFIKEVSREQRDAVFREKMNERLTFYKAMENLLDMQGMDGQDCVLRAICEAAQFPVEDEGLVGEILHILLTPDYGHTLFEEPDPVWTETMSLYIRAAAAGRQMFSCPAVYNGCPQAEGPLDLITTLREY